MYTGRNTTLRYTIRTRKVAAHGHADSHAAKIAYQHIQDPVIPPALVEIGHAVLEGVLYKLPQDAQDPQQCPIPHDKCFRHPPCRCWHSTTY